MAELTRDEQIALVQAFRTGDQKAFERLFDVSSRFLRRSLARLVPADDLEDVVQETMILAYRRIDQFQGEASFTTWVISIGTNVGRVYRRKGKRHAGVIAASIDETVETDSGVSRKLADPVYEDRTAEQNEVSATIEAALGGLRPEYQAIVRMKLQGDSDEEIAGVVGKPVNTVKSLFLRAKAEMRERIDGSSVPAKPKPVRRCKCGCGAAIPPRGWPFSAGHGKRRAA